MTPEEALSDHRLMLDAVGEEITLRRETRGPGNPPVMIPFEATVRARVMGYQPKDLVGGITQGDLKAIVLAVDLETVQWPGPLRQGDKAILRGKTKTIEVVDGNTRRIQGVLIAYELRVTG